jgi:hypothetical protein
MAQVHSIPSTPIYSPLAGISDLYGLYLKGRDAKEEREYKREQDRKQSDFKEREFTTNKDFKERELTDRARKTQSDVDYNAGMLKETSAYHNGELALKADPNSPTNAANLMTARNGRMNAETLSAQEARAAAKAKADEADTRSILGMLGGPPGGANVPLPSSADSALLRQMIEQVNAITGRGQ